MLKKILMTTDTVGGVWTYATELCHAVRPYGIEVALATMGQPLSPAHRQELRSLENVRVYESGFRLEWMDEPWEDVSRAGAWLLKIRDQFHPDVIHLNGYTHGSLPWDTPVLIVGHSCVFSWWQAVHNESPPKRWNRYREQVTRGLKAAGIVAAPSNTMLASLAGIYGPLTSTVVIPNGRDPQYFRLARKLPVIFSAGRLWDPAKNISMLVKIADELSWPLYIAGDNQFEKQRLEIDPPQSPATRNGIRDLGRLPFSDVAGWMAQASIFAWPARYEPFGLSVLEAAFCGCALVLGDIPSLHENWDDAAVFVSPDDPQQIKEVLEELTRKPNELADLGGRARERAQRFTAHEMARGYLDTYQALCDSLSSITR